MANHAPVAYLDSSALIKLVIPEPESDALRVSLARWDRHAASALVRTEVVRAVVRVDGAARDPARLVVRALTLIAVSDEILDHAAELEPSGLRTLDSVHLASALALGDVLGPFVTYDVRLQDAARAAGLDVVAPG
ncbi:MAG: type II toxin-antitoxin system VapC family toxin [Actinobacteria bacterium]|nr:type II toxin-antitoxin system VapC family toxin [Actinomycetota bacterium]